MMKRRKTRIYSTEHSMEPLKMLNLSSSMLQIGKTERENKPSIRKQHNIHKLI